MPWFKSAIGFAVVFVCLSLISYLIVRILRGSEPSWTPPRSKNETEFIPEYFCPEGYVTASITKRSISFFGPKPIERMICLNDYGKELLNFTLGSRKFHPGTSLLLTIRQQSSRDHSVTIRLSEAELAKFNETTKDYTQEMLLRYFLNTTPPASLYYDEKVENMIVSNLKFADLDLYRQYIDLLEVIRMNIKNLQKFRNFELMEKDLDAIQTRLIDALNNHSGARETFYDFFRWCFLVFNAILLTVILIYFLLKPTLTLCLNSVTKREIQSSEIGRN